ncbi:hypothetical protein AB0E62_27625 [Streptomyces sp. NPDC038707]|uniref:hypothetical protein n=1 Tax=Streptomyces sp. NPDC038707 TaxID=3154329 RepID=UPI0033DD00C4
MVEAPVVRALPVRGIGLPCPRGQQPERLFGAGARLGGADAQPLVRVRAGRGVTSPAAGAHAYRRAGVAFLVACSLISLAAGLPARAAAATLIAAVAPRRPLRGVLRARPRHATGQYLGVFGLGAGLAEALGPGLLIALRITWGRPGWYVVGAVFALTGLAAPPAVRWARRPRHTPHARPGPAAAER